MSLLDTLDKIPNKIFPTLEARNFPLYIAWREVCHVIASCLIMTVSYLLLLYGYTNIPIIFFAILGIWMTYQEFYLHPKKYDQPLWNSLLDWSAWMIPFIFYLFVLYKL